MSSPSDPSQGKPRKVSAKSVALGTGALGSPVALFTLHPLLGEVFAAGEFVMSIVIVSAALFGSETISDRAFRLLRWMANRPEPLAPVPDPPGAPPPEGVQPAGSAQHLVLAPHDAS